MFQDKAREMYDKVCLPHLEQGDLTQSLPNPNFRCLPETSCQELSGEPLITLFRHTIVEISIKLAG